MPDIAWVGDQTIQQVIDVMEDWFQAIEAGTANQRLPDLQDKKYSDKEVDEVIRFIDAFIDYEVNAHGDYWRTTGVEGREWAAGRGKPIDLGAAFHRLTGASRLAFVQALKKAKAAAGIVENYHDALLIRAKYLGNWDDLNPYFYGY